MKNPTDMMRSILTDKKAQEIIDYVSPIYGNSYVALWIYQAIGTVLGEVCSIADQLQYETNPATASLLLDYWEKHYGIQRDSTLTKEQRQLRITAKVQSRGPCSPTRLAAAVSAALGGVPVDITENVAKNTFQVNVRDAVDTTPAIAVLEQMKPAHLLYQIQVGAKTEVTAEMKTAVATTFYERFNNVEVLQ